MDNAITEAGAASPPLAARVTALVVRHLGADPRDVTPASLLVSDLGCDSLDLLQVAIGIEREMSIELADAELERITTVQQLIDVVARHAPAGVAV